MGFLKRVGQRGPKCWRNSQEPSTRTLSGGTAGAQWGLEMKAVCCGQKEKSRGNGDIKWRESPNQRELEESCKRSTQQKGREESKGLGSFVRGDYQDKKYSRPCAQKRNKGAKKKTAMLEI